MNNTNTAVAITGEAIVNGIYMPPSEYRVLHALYQCGPASLAELWEFYNSRGYIAKATLTSLVYRLQERGLIEANAVSSPHTSRQFAAWQIVPSITDLPAMPV